MLETAVEAFESRDEVFQEKSPSPIGTKEPRLFHLLNLPSVSGYENKLSNQAEVLLEESKTVVPLVLSEPLDIRSLEESGFSLSGFAEGEGFTCSVFRKQSRDSHVPVYVITGELDISADAFHALVCDVSFRRNWDDQFHHATAVEIEKSISLVEWVVKWPWPLAPREYRYVLSPHRFDDGTNLVLAASVPHEAQVHSSSVPVREYFGITGAKATMDNSNRCRYCVFYYDDPTLPGRMPGWLEQYVAKQLLPSFPRKVLSGAKMYPKDRFLHYSQLGSTTEFKKITS